MPRSAGARAKRQPSFSIDSIRKPPPGATITARPLASAGSGRNGVSVAVETLRVIATPYWRNQASGACDPATPPVPSGIAVGSAGAAVGTIRASCASAGAASASTTPKSAVPQ